MQIPCSLNFFPLLLISGASFCTDVYDYIFECVFCGFDTVANCSKEFNYDLRKSRGLWVELDG